MILSTSADGAGMSQAASNAAPPPRASKAPATTAMRNVFIQRSLSARRAALESDDDRTFVAYYGDFGARPRCRPVAGGKDVDLFLPNSLSLHAAFEV